MLGQPRNAYWEHWQSEASGLSQPAGCKAASEPKENSLVGFLDLLLFPCVCMSSPSRCRSLTRHLHTQFVRSHSAAIWWLLVHFWVSAHSKPLTHSKGTFISRCLARTWELKSAGNAQGFQQLAMGKKNPLSAHIIASFIPFVSPI